MLQTQWSAAQRWQLVYPGACCFHRYPSLQTYRLLPKPWSQRWYPVPVMLLSRLLRAVENNHFPWAPAPVANPGSCHSCRPDPSLSFQMYEPINLQSVTLLFYASYFKLVIWFWREEVLVISLGGLDLCWKVSGSLEKSRSEPMCRDRKWVCRLETLQRAEQEQTVKGPHTLTVIAAVKGTLWTGCFICHLWPLPH